MQTFHTFGHPCCSVSSWEPGVALVDTDGLQNVPPSVLLLSVSWNEKMEVGVRSSLSHSLIHTHRRENIKIKWTKIIEMAFSYWSLGDESLVEEWSQADWRAVPRLPMVESDVHQSIKWDCSYLQPVWVSVNLSLSKYDSTFYLFCCTSWILSLEGRKKKQQRNLNKTNPYYVDSLINNNICFPCFGSELDIIWIKPKYK